MELMLVEYGSKNTEYFLSVQDTLSKDYKVDVKHTIVELITHWHIKQHNVIVLFIQDQTPDKSELMAFLKHAKEELPVKIVIVSDVDEAEKIDAHLYLPWNTKKEYVVRNIEELLEIQKQPHYYRIKENIFIDMEGNEFKLTDMQCRVLEVLIANKNQVMTREEILEQCGKDNGNLNPRNIDIHIKNIREKTGIRNIVSLRGRGYKWID